jgi:hypothetical protein
MDWDRVPYRMAYQVTRLDLFRLLSMGYIKDLVCQAKVQDADELRGRVNAACETVIPAMLQNTWRKAEYRLDICRPTKGAYVGIY